jgi:hypothetical protein
VSPSLPPRRVRDQGHPSTHCPGDGATSATMGKRRAASRESPSQIVLRSRTSGLTPGGSVGSPPQAFDPNPEGPPIIATQNWDSQTRTRRRRNTESSDYPRPEVAGPTVNIPVWSSSDLSHVRHVAHRNVSPLGGPPPRRSPMEVGINPPKILAPPDIIGDPTHSPCSHGCFRLACRRPVAIGRHGETDGSSRKAQEG